MGNERRVRACLAWGRASHWPLKRMSAGKPSKRKEESQGRRTLTAAASAFRSRSDLSSSRAKRSATPIHCPRLLILSLWPLRSESRSAGAPTCLRPETPPLDRVTDSRVPPNTLREQERELDSQSGLWAVAAPPLPTGRTTQEAAFSRAQPVPASSEIPKTARKSARFLRRYLKASDEAGR